jgi:hypothetical protein
MSGWCERDGAVYVSGPTYGRSPRVLVIAGQRAVELASGEHGVNVRCLDCAIDAVVQAAGVEAVRPARLPA